jgi:hypothetical protein
LRRLSTEHKLAAVRKAPHDADAAFRDALAQLPEALEESFRRLVAQGPLALHGTEITRAVLLRMAAFYQAQLRMMGFLGKHYMGAAADFFVETVVFFLRVLATTHQLDIEIAAERQIRRARGAMRPDISIWRDDKCLACIECKTQLGWKRHGWEAQFIERERRLLLDHTGACSFLLVLTAKNWGGFGTSPNVGKKYFVLSNVWPTGIDFDQLEDAVITPIESLFVRVVELARPI